MVMGGGGGSRSVPGALGLCEGSWDSALGSSFPSCSSVSRSCLEESAPREVQQPFWDASAWRIPAKASGQGDEGRERTWRDDSAAKTQAVLPGKGFNS